MTKKILLKSKLFVKAEGTELILSINILIPKSLDPFHRPLMFQTINSV